MAISNDLKRTIRNMITRTDEAEELIVAISDVDVAGGVTSIAAGVGLAGGPITTTGTISLAQMPASTLKGNNTGVTANPANLTGAQVNTILPTFTPTLKGLAPASGGGIGNFLRADGTWTNVNTGIGNSAISNLKLTTMPGHTIKGNNSATTAGVSDLTVAQVNVILPVFTSALNGLAPASGGGTSNFLRADGTWTSPGGGANTALSNLAAVAINTDLVFAASTIGTIKTADGADSAVMWVKSGDSTDQSGDVNIQSGYSDDTSGTVKLTSGVGLSASGGIQLEIGSSTGTKGFIRLADGTEGVQGDVWTSINSAGDGHWVTPTAGANTALSNLTSPTSVNQDLNLSGHQVNGVSNLNNTSVAAGSVLLIFTADGTTVILTPTPGHVHYVAHGIADNDAIVFAGSDLPAPLVAGTTYYASVGNVDNFRINAISGGSPVTLTTTGSGVVTVQTPDIVTNNWIHIGASLIPTLDGTFSLGSRGGEWASAFIGSIYSTVNANSIDLDNTNLTLTASNDLYLNPVGAIKLGNTTDAQGFGIINLLDPVNPQDAATKNYVDTHIPAAGADTTLSNLSGTTAISQELAPLSNLTTNIGDGSHRWNELFVGSISDNSGSTGGAAEVLTANGSGQFLWAAAAGAGFQILALSSNPSVGGAVSEAMIVPGLLTSDTILSVSQQIQGASTRTSLSFIGWDTVVAGGLTAQWVADPGPGAVLLVAIKRVP